MPRTQRILLFLNLFCIWQLDVFLISTLSQNQPSGYLTEIKNWRTERQNNLLADDGWLTVTGLFFLKEGHNSFGTNPDNDIVLPAGPKQAGSFELRNRQVTLHTDTDQTLTIKGKRVSTALLYPSPTPQEIVLESVTLFVHKSGNRLAIRMRDTNSKIRKEFKGLNWYPVNESYRVPAKFIPHEEPMKITVQNVLGDIEEFVSHGLVRLTLDGEEIEMLPVDSDGLLWFIFRDLTSGTETYRAARFLYAEPPKNGWTIIDFNRAYNPPCAFNPFTTCPLPPTMNRLKLRIESGELDYDEKR